MLCKVHPKDIDFFCEKSSIQESSLAYSGSCHTDHAISIADLKPEEIFLLQELGIDNHLNLEFFEFSRVRRQLFIFERNL